MPPARESPEEARFTWPPRRPVEVQPPAPSAPGPGQPRRRGPVALPPPRRGPWAAFELDVLGLTAAPLADRAAEAEWAPDTPANYCLRCGLTTTAAEQRPGGCHRCEGVKFAWERFVRLGEYRGDLRRWVHEVKFTRWRRLGVDLGRLLGTSLLRQWEACGRPGGSSNPPLLVPIPESALRRIWRGIDHTGAIVAGVREMTGWPIGDPVRRRWGPSQRSVPPSQRASNAARSFGICVDYPWRSLCNRVVVLVDDVVTSGSTMRICGKLIANACQTVMKGDRTLSGPRVWVGCLARTPLDEPGRRAVV